jgi:hypothetical protein
MPPNNQNGSERMDANSLPVLYNPPPRIAEFLPPLGTCCSINPALSIIVVHMVPTDQRFPRKLQIAS